MTVVGVIGGGQLARMMIPAAVNLGIDISVFAETEGSSAHLGQTQIGDFTDLSQLAAFARTVDVITFDHEHVPLAHLHALREEGAVIHPPPEALALTHDKTVMRNALHALGLPQPRFAILSSLAEGEQAVSEVGGFPCVAKLPVGGYDGKGVRVIQSLQDCADWISAGPVLLEEFVDFHRELSQLSARRPGGQWVPWLPVETRQSNGVCSEVLSPAPGVSEELVAEARSIAHTIAESLGVVGVLAVELFELPNGQLLVNELAMRPHNSGHVLTEQSVTSQFEQHLRAVADIPLGSAALREPAGAMVNIFGSARFAEYSLIAADFPEVKFHSYQKQPRPGRKAGHFVVTGEDSNVTLERAKKALQALQGVSA
jgi:5-(carboxyamino)imidazole ribonucleotide synthase